jgi:hypothetical protein
MSSGRNGTLGPRTSRPCEQLLTSFKASAAEAVERPAPRRAWAFLGRVDAVKLDHLGVRPAAGGAVGAAWICERRCGAQFNASEALEDRLTVRQGVSL